MSLHDSFEFKDFIPNDLYKKYFNTMVKNESIYVCIIQSEDQVGSIYLESPTENVSTVDGVVRVFFYPQDLKKYAESVSALENIPFELIKRWEMKFSSLVEYVAKLDAKNKSEGTLGVRAIASAVHSDKFLDIDVLWTSERKFMV